MDNTTKQTGIKLMLALKGFSEIANTYKEKQNTAWSKTGEGAILGCLLAIIGGVVWLISDRLSQEKDKESMI